jgi:hypothetical protein
MATPAPTIIKAAIPLANVKVVEYLHNFFHYRGVNDFDLTNVEYIKALFFLGE